MSGRKDQKPDPAERGWMDYRKTEDIGEREVDETEEQIRRGEDVDGDGTPDPAVGSSDFVSRDVKTELEKDTLRKRRD